MPVLCLAQAQEVQRVEADVLVIWIDRLTPALQTAAGPLARPRVPVEFPLAAEQECSHKLDGLWRDDWRFEPARKSPPANRQSLCSSAPRAKRPAARVLQTRVCDRAAFSPRLALSVELDRPLRLERTRWRGAVRAPPDRYERNVAFAMTAYKPPRASKRSRRQVRRCERVGGKPVRRQRPTRHARSASWSAVRQLTSGGCAVAA